MPTQNSWNNNNTGAASTTLVGSTINISNDAVAATVNIGTGAAAKTVTIGSTNSTSPLVLRYGTNDFTLASATGTVMSALDTGEITYPLQSAFLAYLGSTDTDVTGNGTVWRLGETTALTEVFDQNGDFNTNGTFTAPVTGRYCFSGQMSMLSAVGGGQQATGYIVTSNRTIYGTTLPTRNRVTNFYGTNDYITLVCYVVADLDSGDTADFRIVSETSGAKTDDVVGGASPIYSFFCGYLMV